MNNYKKVVLLSLFFAAIFFLIGNWLKKKDSECIPDPELHIREVMEYLKSGDKKGFKNLMMTEEVFKTMSKEEAIEYFSGFERMNESMTQILFEAMEKMGDEFWKNFENSLEDGYKKVRKKIKDWKNIEIVRIQWKMVGNSNVTGMHRCNAKIYVKVDSEEYCIRYKNFLFFAGRWLAGTLVDVERIDEPDYMPDMYQSPPLNEYLQEYNTEEFPEEAMPESEAQSLEIPSEKVEED